MPAEFMDPTYLPDTVIWRYMDLSKFVSMLIGTESVPGANLYFARTDRLGDRFEGTVPSQLIDINKLELRRATKLKQASIDNPLNREYSDYQRLYKPGHSEHPKLKDTIFLREAAARSQYGYVSCWHKNPGESSALWRLYLKSDEGIAVRSTLGRLCKALPEAIEAKICQVRYVDPEELGDMEADPLKILLSKRASFKHEVEYRAVIQPKEMIEKYSVSYIEQDKKLAQRCFCKHDGTQISIDGGIAELLKGAGNTPAGMTVPVDLTELIERVYVAPGSPKFFIDVVKAIRDRFNYGNLKVTPSKMDEPI